MLTASSHLLCMSRGILQEESLHDFSRGWGEADLVLVLLFPFVEGEVQYLLSSSYGAPLPVSMTFQRWYCKDIGQCSQNLWLQPSRVHGCAQGDLSQVIHGLILIHCCFPLGTLSLSREAWETLLVKTGEKKISLPYLCLLLLNHPPHIVLVQCFAMNVLVEALIGPFAVPSTLGGLWLFWQ